MKRSLILWAMALLIAHVAFSQTRPAGMKTFPKMIRFEQPVNVGQKHTLFTQHLEATADDQMLPVKTFSDHLGFTHEKYQQYYKGIKVEGATYTLHMKGGQVSHMSGSFEYLRDIDINPSISAAAALAAATGHVGANQYAWQPGNTLGIDDYQKPDGELVLLPDYLNDQREPAKLAWKFDIYASDPIYRAWVFVDAKTGRIIQTFERIHEANVPATGTSLYNGTVSFTADDASGPYRLRQTADGNGVETYDLNNGTNYNNATDITSGSTNFTHATGVQAHYGAEQTHKYFLQSHGRNSYNGAGAVLRSYVSYSSNYVNAFWDGTRMTYGDGDGVNYGPLVSLDITGHEIAHGVTEFSANLVYQRESGALNESFSDIFGEMVEKFAVGTNDWQMGTDIGIGGSGAIRSMDNPNAFNDPDTYGGSFWTNPNCGTPTQSNDYCGVHSNSGVQNKWFYILSEGETGTNDIGSSYSVTGIGTTKAAEIAYRNLTVYLGTSSTFADARAGAIQSAVDLYGAGSAEEIATTNAWYAVGVGGEYGTISYCNSQSNNVNDEYIGRVQLNTIDNTSGAQFYTDFTSISTDLAVSTGYTITVTPIWTGTIYNEGYSVWIDYNADGDFTDAGEQVWTQGATTASPVSGSFTVPATATAGQTRMRVSMKYNGIPTACESFTYGEVEDYTINITTGGGDTQAPTTPGNLTASNTTQTSTDLSWTASTDNVGVSGYNVYVDGNLDGTTTSLSYSVTGLTASTSYTMTVTAEDAAGNESSPASVNVTTSGGGGGTPVTLSADFFETGWDGWIDGGGDATRVNTSASWEGIYSIRLRDNSGTASSMTKYHDLTGYNEVQIEFYFYPNSMETGEDFWLRYYDGSSWTTLAAYASGSSFNNGSFYVGTVTLDAATHNFNSSSGFRFQCDASSNADQIYMDAITISATTGSFPFNEGIQTIASGFMGWNNSSNGIEAEATIFPNPVLNELNIETDDQILSVKIYAANGALVLSKEVEGELETLDVSALAAGMYQIAIETVEETVFEKFAKR